MKTLIIVITILAVVFIGWWLFVRNPNNQEPLPSVTPSSTISSGTSMLNWPTHHSQEADFSIQYWPEMKVRKDNLPGAPGVNFYYYGSTQTADTEIFDGISLTIRRDSFSDSFEQYIARDIQQTEDVGRVISPLADQEVAGIKGRAYTAETLGVHRKIFLPVGNNEVIAITYLNPDPENRGYQNTVDAMLTTFQVPVGK